SPKVPYKPNSPVVGSHWTEYDCVSILLLSCPALTPSVLRLLAIMAMYLTFACTSPFTHTPCVYEPRKNSSAMSRSSTPSQYGNCPAVLRVEGREVMPAPTDA